MFTNAKGGVPLCVTKGQHESKVVGQAQPKVEPKKDQRSNVKCMICGKLHPTFKCWHKHNIWLFPVQRLIPSIGEVFLIGVRIGNVVEMTSVTIIITTITGPTIS